jgi:hypothetical protein
MSETLDKRNRPNFGEIKIDKPDERIEYWTANSYKGLYEALKFCEFIPPDTPSGQEKKALAVATGSEEPRLGVADRDTEWKFTRAMEAYFSIRAMEKEREARQDQRSGLIRDLKEYLEEHPEEIWSTGETVRGTIDESLHIDSEAFRYLDLKAAMAACFDTKYRAGLEESNRNLRMYEEKTAEVTFRTSEKRIQDFLGDDWKL